jgi:MATE family multidrug resistance protein
VVIIVTDVGIDFLTVHNICQNVFIFTYFMSEGIQRTVVGLGANLLGAGKGQEIWQLISSAITMQLITLLILAVPLLFFPSAIASLYTSDPKLIAISASVLFWVWIYYIIDGVAWIFGAALASGGDTKFIACVVFVSVWFARVVPFYMLEQADMVDYGTSWMIFNTGDLIVVGVFYARLKWGNWRKVVV